MTWWMWAIVIVVGESALTVLLWNLLVPRDE